MKLIIVRGIPGSGKSFYVKKNFNCLHVEADMFFMTWVCHVVIENMYPENRDGHAYQGCGDLKKDSKIEKLCGEIHDRLKEISLIIENSLTNF